MAAKRSLTVVLAIATIMTVAAPVAAENWSSTVWSMSTWASGLMMFYFDLDSGNFKAALRTACNSGRTDYDLYYMEGRAVSDTELRGTFVMVNAERSDFAKGTVTITAYPEENVMVISYSDERGMEIQNMRFEYSRLSDDYWNGIAESIARGIRESFE